MGELLEPPSPYWVSDEGDVTLYLGKCEKVLPGLPANSVDAIVTDPPAAIAFMGRSWDSDLGGRDKWVGWLSGCMEAAARVLKPGGHLLVWSLPRTSHWTAWALEDAGLEIRDCILHLFGSGFPKSLDVSKAIDKLKRRDYVLAAIELGLEVPGNNLHDWTKAEHSPGDEWWERFKAHLSPEDWQRIERAVIGRARGKGTRATIGPVGIKPEDYDLTAPATEDAARWSGFGTALKPGQEMWWLARKPLAAGTVAANVLEFGTGALNIAACKVGSEARVNNAGGMGSLQNVSRVEHGYREHVVMPSGEASEVTGRWPSNIVFTHSESCEMTGTRLVRGDSRSGQQKGQRPGGFGDIGADSGDEMPNGALHGDQEIEVWACDESCPVAELDRQSGVLTSGANPERRRSDKFRDAYGEFAGQETCIPARGADAGGASRFYPTFRYQAKAPSSERPRLEDGTAHETVKSLDLTRWQVRLITPPGGTVLDMFGGSGPVPEACIIEGFRCIVIEKERSSAELIKTRLSKPIQPVMFGFDEAS